ncbi:hypothetical protein OBBRIDRAFT_182869 [Obba rivulosa]|uniref:Uncharacterized protein n=1 Tax=Obba rivulosa TaxID=1052685 RepID=A0A8E2ALW8_9APHY|nr:hypothetical protein OBBRIDRAFT_182869 [Obba rivulosa]
MENVAPADGDRDKPPRSLSTLDYLLQSSSRGTKRSTRTSSLMTAARTLSRTQSASSSSGDIGLPTPPASQQDVFADPSRTLMSPPPKEILKITDRTSMHLYPYDLITHALTLLGSCPATESVSQDRLPAIVRIKKTVLSSERDKLLS